MKNLLFILLIVVAITNVSAQNSLSLGVYSSCAGNESKFSDGSPNASALFTHSKYGEMSFGFLARYFVGNHWSFQSGVNGSSIGFNYGIAKDYSLSKMEDHYTRNKVDVSVLQIPLTAILSSKPNCRNVRLYIGGGVNIMTHFSNLNKTNDVSIPTEEKSLTPDYLNQTVTVSPFLAITGQMVWGIERLLKHGNIMQLGFVANRGFTNIATSTVTYSVNNTMYSHTFSNKGNYMGMTMSYYFRPLKKK